VQKTKPTSVWNAAQQHLETTVWQSILGWHKHSTNQNNIFAEYQMHQITLALTKLPVIYAIHLVYVQGVPEKNCTKFNAP